MGDMTLGCLLGQYDRAQSFDVDSAGALTQVHSWAKTGQSSWFLVGCPSPGYVHSSQQSLRIDVFSRAGSDYVLSYGYGFANDAFARWFPEVTTHAVEAAAWVLLSPLPASGGFRFQLSAQPEVSAPLPGGNLGTHALTFQRLATTAHSQGTATPRTGMHIPGGTSITSQTTLVVDDVLTTVDAIPLHPEWSFEERAQILRAQHRTRSGLLHTLVWEKFFAYTVPLRFLSDSHAALINWWWERQWALLLTLDTSDSESLYLVRIANETQPIGRRVRPYEDRWEGTLELESLGPGGLAF
jgi:hypothetical protein